MIHKLPTQWTRWAEHHAGARPERGRRNVRHDDGVLALRQPGLHGRLVLEHVQAHPAAAERAIMQRLW